MNFIGRHKLADRQNADLRKSCERSFDAGLQSIPFPALNAYYVTATHAHTRRTSLLRHPANTVLIIPYLQNAKQTPQKS